MGRIVLLGDPHGDFAGIEKVCQDYKDDTVLGIGDIGVGFGPHTPEFPDNFKYILGNHDHPKYRTADKCLGKFGMWNGMFFLSGADSIDKKLRTSGVDWWPDEQLSREDMELALNEYADIKPDILISHEAPFRIHGILHEMALFKNPTTVRWGEPRGNSTAYLLDAMIQIHAPKRIYFGHWHNTLSFTVRGTQYNCLDIMQPLILPSV